jgi:hypothetical protein
MILVEQGPWEGLLGDNLRRLQERLYECLDAVLDGQLADKYPSSRGKAVVIQVDGYGLPRNSVESFFSRFAEGVLQTGGYARDAKENEFASQISFELNLK